MNIRRITTATGKYGLGNNSFVNLRTGKGVAGYVHQLNLSSQMDVHISRGCLWDPVKFTAVAGHELIHVVHINTVAMFSRNYSEAYAYRFSSNVYLNNGRFASALYYYHAGNQWASWSSIPEIYHIQTPVWGPWN
jgi:hypothetical protein